MFRALTTRSVRSAFGPRSTGGCGPRFELISRSMQRGARSASTIPATARPTLSTAQPVKPAPSEPATAGRLESFGSQESGRACGRRSHRGSCGVIADKWLDSALEHVAAEVGIAGDARKLLFNESGVDDQGLADAVLSIEANVL